MPINAHEISGVEERMSLRDARRRRSVACHDVKKLFPSVHHVIPLAWHGADLHMLDIARLDEWRMWARCIKR